MNRTKKVLSFMLMGIGMILTVMFVIQLTEIFIKESRFLFFQILLVMIWGLGAFIFWIAGITITKSSKNNEEK